MAFNREPTDTAPAASASGRTRGLKAFIDDFALLDASNPHQAYASVRHRSGKSDTALIALAAIDDALRERLGQQTLYVLDDRSVHAVLTSAQLNSITESELRRICFELSLVQLVFRFASALKFKVRDTSVKQLRINSWGRSYCEHVLHERSRRQWAELRSVATEIIDARRIQYQEIGALLRAPITAQSARRVAALNRTLKLKVVS